ncbi:alpha-2-macroglobulin family protein [Salinispira pacifica]|uniref:Alpha-2-macroglobulin domain-containing protein n=1 Tax=Salinispira pacifica TaxID=1307761 RepID=V5WF44_9SPIO|nr:MG2 domain-containing protein [Salinispira pacifica]AHC14422.1 hypothetical protein L21SP2_1004 [Salinispira pacifica]
MKHLLSRPERSVSPFAGVVFILIAGTVVFSFSACGGEDPADLSMEERFREAENPQARSEITGQIQAGLINEESREAAGQFLQMVERERFEATGIIRESVDLSASTINYYSVNPMEAMAVLGTIGQAGEGGELNIADRGPEGLLPAENRSPRIYVMFNQPMVPLAKLGAEITGTEILNIEPAIPGVYRWYGTRTIGFQPDAPMIDEEFYRVSVLPGVTSLTGARLEEGIKFNIYPERLELVNFYPGTPEDFYPRNYNVPPTYASSLVLEFNQEVDPTVLGGYIELKLDDQPAAYSIRRPRYSEALSSRTPRALLLELSEVPPPSTRVSVTLKEGAVPRDGFPAIERETSQSIRTISRFRVYDIRSSAYSFPRDNREFSYPLYLRFSHPLSEKQGDRITSPETWHIRVNGEAVQPDSVELSGSYVRFTVPSAAPGDVVRISVPPVIQDVFDRNLSNPGEAGPHTIPRPRPFVNFPGRSSRNLVLRHLESAFDPLILFSFRNQQEFLLGSSEYDPEERISSQLSGISMRQLDLSRIPEDTVRFETVDLSPYLNEQGRGTALISWMARDDREFNAANEVSSSDNLMVTVTNIGITSRVSYNSVLVWLNSLSDGYPLEGASVRLVQDGIVLAEGRSDGQGLAVIGQEDGYGYRDREGLSIQVVHENDRAELPFRNTHNAWRFGVNAVYDPKFILEDRSRVHLFTDRGLYKGGEELALRGIHWIQDENGYRSADTPYRIRGISKNGGEEIWSASGRTSGSGGFHHRFTLPENLDSGDYRIQYELDGRSIASADFYVSDFQRASFQVTSSIAEETELLAGESMNARVSASYLAGGSLASGEYNYVWTRKPVTFRPDSPRWEHWSFGTTQWSGEKIVSSGAGSLASDGSARIAVQTGDEEIPWKPYLYNLEVRVSDLDRREISSRTQRIVHPDDLYIAARFGSSTARGWWSRFIPTGDSADAQFRLVTIEGDTADASGELEYGIIRKVWKSVQQQGMYGRLNTRWELVDEPVEEGRLAVEQGGAALQFSVPDSGRHVLYVQRTGEDGRQNRTEIPFYASGSGWVQTASQTPSDIELVVDKNLYSPGETARILVQSPVPQGRYLLTLEREGIFEQRVLDLDSGTEVIEVEISEEHLPVVYAAITGFTPRGEIPREYGEPDLGKPRSLFGVTEIRVSRDAVRLDVEIQENQGVRSPGSKADISLRVTKDGEPVPGAEVTLLAVDRGVLDLIDYRIPDPLEYFYNPAKFPLAVMGDDSRRLLLDPVTYDISTLQGGDGSKIEEREDFNPLALFEPAVITDEEGYARVDFQLPDTLTTYRITALAMDGTRLGMDESEMMVQNPINMRSALPLQLRTRDTAAAGVILNNLSGEEVEVSVTAESDLLSISGESTRKLTIPAETVVELPFVFQALKEGRGSVHFTLESALLNERLTEEIRVERPLLKEAFTTMATISERSSGNGGGGGSAALEGLVIPSAIAEGYGSLQVNLSSSLRTMVMPAAEELLIPLWHGEDRHSVFARLFDLNARMLGYGRGDGGAPGGVELPRINILSRLDEYQFQEGGIGLRSPRDPWTRPNRFLSILTAHSLQLADERGISIEHDIDRRLLMRYLSMQIRGEKFLSDSPVLASWLAQILAREGLADEELLDAVAAREDELGIAGYNMLAEAYAILGSDEQARQLHRRSRNFVNIGTQSLDVRQSYERRSYFSSMEMETAALLRTGAILEDDPDYLLRLANTLARTRNSRRFHSAMDSYWLLYGFSPLLQREQPGRSMSAELLVNDQSLYSGSLTDQTETDEHRVSLELELFEPPLGELKRDVLHELSIRKNGGGPLYYTGTLRYALPGETALPRDEGIEVRTQIETLEGDVLTEDVLTPGTTYRMRVFLSTLRRLSYLNLDVPIPSGAQVLDPNLEITGSYTDAGGLQSEEYVRETQYGDTAGFLGDGFVNTATWNFWFYRPVQRYYAGMISYSWEDFYAGEREVSFLFRAATPGIYPTPGAQASLEFEPEIFGRSAGRLVVIPSDGTDSR